MLSGARLPSINSGSASDFKRAKGLSWHELGTNFELTKADGGGRGGPIVCQSALNAVTARARR